MRERKAVKENGLVDAADKFDDMYQRMEALASHAHDLIKHAGDEKLVGDWWENMQAALEKMQSVSGEIRQPSLPGLETTKATEQDTDQAQVQEEEEMTDIEEMISRLAKLAGLGEAGGHKPDADKDGIPDWADKHPHKAGGDEDRVAEGTCPHCHEDPCVCEAVDESDISGLMHAASSTVAGTPVAESISDDIEPEDAYNLAAELEEQVEHLSRTLASIEHTVRTKLPRAYRSMERYTFAHIKAAIGGHGHAGNHMSKTLVGLIEDLGERSNEVDESDISGLMHAARNYNNSFIKDESVTVVDEGKFGNSVAGPKGDPKVVGDTIDFAVPGTGNAKSGRGDKGLSTFGDNPLGRNDRDLTEDKMMSEFSSWLKEQQKGK